MKFNISIAGLVLGLSPFVLALPAAGRFIVRHSQIEKIEAD
jgi:hypothetical protein